MTSGSVPATIRRAELPGFLAAVAKSAVVYAPVRLRDAEAVDLEAVAGPGMEGSRLDELALDYSNTRHGPKRLFFPQTETLLRFEADAVSPASAPERPPIVAFGIRPCDARSVTYLDKIFDPGLTKYGDPYYAARRAKSILIAYACSSPCRSCFCTSLGGGPAATEGADVLATEIDGGRLLFEAVSDKGKAFMAEHAASFAAAGETEAAQATGSHDAARKAVPSLEHGPVDREGLKRRLDLAFDDPIWNRLTERCIGCGACTYLCPTCHCFDIADESHQYKGRRIRTWDSCQFQQFTKHASGHNPRPARKHRLRQRFMHKLSYTVEKSGDIYCVGCGRCVEQCPVNLDIREIIGAFSAPEA